MLLTISIDERPVFEVGLGHGFTLSIGDRDFILHRPGGNARFTWETRNLDFGPEGLRGRPMRCHDTVAQWGAWELIWTRRYPIPGTVDMDREGELAHS